MIGAVLDRVDRILGRGRHSIAVPVMDGPLHPNNRLEEAALLFAGEGVDNLAVSGGDLFFSSGNVLKRRDADGGIEDVATHDAEITCLAANPAGALAVGLDGTGIIIRGGANDGRRVEKIGEAPLLCPTAAVFLDDDTLALAVGTRDLPFSDWKRDLMRHGSTGSVWQVDLSSDRQTKLAGDLAFPYGICPTPDGLVVTECWAHRLVLVTGNARPKALLDELPGYPARIVARSGGGYAMAVFAARNQLIEFVLREPEFLRAMTEQVHPNHWIAPKLMWGEGFKEPMQGAALKTMGIIKPWAPTWSYGLVVELDHRFWPVRSFHSRADGSRHGVTSVCDMDGTVLAAARGAGVVVQIPPVEAGGRA